MRINMTPAGPFTKKEYEKGQKVFCKMFLLLILLGIGLEFGCSYLLDKVLGFMPNVKSAYLETLSALIEWNFRTVFMVSLLAPVVEETIFRVIFLGAGVKFLPFYLANIIQALLFGIYHWNWVQGVYAFILGSLLGYIYYHSGFRASSVLVHITINIMGILIQFIPFLNGENNGVVVDIVGIIALIVVGVTLYILHGIWNGKVTCTE